MARVLSTLSKVSVENFREVNSKYDTIKFIADNLEEILKSAESVDILNKYAGASETHPTERLNGDPLEDGDFYFGTADSIEGLFYYKLSDTSWFKPETSTGGGSVNSVNGDIGHVTITAGSIGLGDVNNTSDLEKPISDAVSIALLGKVDKAKVLTDVPLGAKFTDTTYEVKDGELSEINFTSTKDDKLSGIQEGATPDQSGSDIKSLYESQSNTNAFTNAHKTKLENIDGSDYATSEQGDKADTAVQPSDLTVKQDNLVSGSSIKTVNGSSILGSGNIEIDSGTSYDDSDVLKDSDTVSPVTTGNKLITEADVTGGGDMSKSTYDSSNSGIVDNAEKVNNLTVETSVPSDAKFTDTIYDDTSIQSEVSLNSAKVGITPQQSADIETNNLKVSNVDHPLVEKAVPSNAVFTDTTYSNVSEFVNDAGYLTEGAKGDDGESAYQVAVSNGFSGTESVWLDSLKGSDGSDGSDGSKGDQGLQGIAGEKGDTGDQGLQGDPGTNGISTPTEIVTEIPASPVTGTLYIVV